MAKFETLDIQGWAPAMHGARHPLQSYHRADSYYDEKGNFVLGENDYDLAKRLVNAGSPEHAKFLRMINVWVDITAPRGFWQEYSTYKIGTTENSHSTMHTLMKTGVSEDDFDYPWRISILGDMGLSSTINIINELIDSYNECSDKEKKEKLFQIIKGLLPESYMQTRTCHLNYQTLQNMYKQRKNHRLLQWNTDFVSWVKTLPYNEFITQIWPE